MDSGTSLKIPLPQFLKHLTSNGISMPKAMAVASKIYKNYHTPSTLSQLTDIKLKAAGIDDKDERKLVLTALRKAGYVTRLNPIVQATTSAESNEKSTDRTAKGGPSTLHMTTIDVVTTPTKKRKSRASNTDNEFLPGPPIDEAAVYGSLEFNEVTDEEILRTKSTVVNRAPLMTAWATIVAERMGFRREEALSIASVYTEMNAISKGVSLGIFEEGRKAEMEAARSGSQPYVDLMGRRALYQTQSAQWRALSNNVPVQPSTAFSYISRALRQTTPHIVGALRLLAASFTPQELNDKGWSLYADFRPTVEGWGKRAEVRCDAILALRKQGRVQGALASGGTGGVDLLADVVKFENNDVAQQKRTEEQEPKHKKHRGLSLEEYEAELDEDTTFLPC